MTNPVTIARRYAMVCSNCGKSEVPGTIYSFYHGRVRGKDSQYIGGAYKVTTHWDTFGPTNVFLCDACIVKHLPQPMNRLLALACGAMSLIVGLSMLYLVSWLWRRDVMAGVAFVGLFSLIFVSSGLIFLAMCFGDQTDRQMYQGARAGTPESVAAVKRKVAVADVTQAGDTLAIELNKKTLRGQGFEQFWTRAEYDESRAGS